MRWRAHLDDAGPEADVRPTANSPAADSRFNIAEHLLDGDQDDVVYVFDGAPVPRSAVKAMSARIAGALHSAGVGPGTRVLLRLRDSPELAASLLAVFSLGAIAIPTFVQYGSDELRYRVRDADVDAVLVEFGLEVAVHEALREVPESVSVLEVAPGAPMMVGDAQAPAGEPTHPDDVALILYTSGSTGKPKGTCHTHGDLLSVCDTYGAATLRLSKSDVIAGTAAMPFALGFALFFLYPLKFGCTALLDADKSPERSLDLVSRHRATILVGVATFFAMMVKRLVTREAGLNVASLRACLTGGERVTESLEEAWLGQTGLRLTQFLGTTEMLGCFIGASPDALPVGGGVIGPPVSGYELVVRDVGTLEPVADGEQGLLSVRGPTSTKYWRRPDKQREAVRDGWNLVPDIVYMVSGQVHFIGRQDDVIKSAGFRISPSQVEEVLERHPAVHECACVRARDPDGIRPEVIKACVVLHDATVGSESLKQELQAFVKASAPPYLYPRVVEFVDSLPRTASGKLQRSLLRSP